MTVLASLSDLPTELFLLILQYTNDAATGHKNLIALSLTCKALRARSLPILLERICCTSEPEVAQKRLQLFKAQGRFVRSLEFSFKHHWLPESRRKEQEAHDLTSRIAKAFRNGLNPATKWGALGELHKAARRQQRQQSSFEQDALCLAARVILAGRYTPNLETCIIKFDLHSNAVNLELPNQAGGYEVWANENIMNPFDGKLAHKYCKNLMPFKEQYGERAFTYAAEQEVGQLWRARMALIWRALAQNSTIRVLRIRNLIPKITSVFATDEWRAFMARLHTLDIRFPDDWNHFKADLQWGHCIAFAEINDFELCNPDLQGGREYYIFFERLTGLFVQHAVNLDSLTISPGEDYPTIDVSGDPNCCRPASLHFGLTVTSLRLITFHEISLEADIRNYLRKAGSLEILELQNCWCRDPSCLPAPITWADIFDALSKGAPRLRQLHILAPRLQKIIRPPRRWCNTHDRTGCPDTGVKSLLKFPKPLEYRSAAIVGSVVSSMRWNFCEGYTVERCKLGADYAAYVRLLTAMVMY